MGQLRHYTKPGHVTGPSRSGQFNVKAVGIRAQEKTRTHTHTPRRDGMYIVRFEKRNLIKVRAVKLKCQKRYSRQRRIKLGQGSIRRQTPRRDESEQLFLPVCS